MDIKAEIVKVSRATWGGLPHSSQKQTLLELYTLLDWFVEKTKDNYLSQNAKSIVKGLKKDNPPKLFVKALITEEKKKKNRNAVLEALNELIE